jgi:hypothetical protein
VALPFLGGGTQEEDFEAAQDDPVFESQQVDDEKGDVLYVDAVAGEEEADETATLEPPLPDLPEECELPTLEEYKVKWAGLFEKHSKHVPGMFGPGNLCPKPVPQLWSDYPYVPFDSLVSTESQARLSMCRPISGLQENSVVNGVEKYAHILGDVHFSRRAAWQLASTMGFIVKKNTGSFLRLKPEERRALHECMVWGSQRGR